MCVERTVLNVRYVERTVVNVRTRVERTVWCLAMHFNFNGV